MGTSKKCEYLHKYIYIFNTYTYIVLHNCICRNVPQRNHTDLHVSQQSRIITVIVSWRFISYADFNEIPCPPNGR